MSDLSIYELEDIVWDDFERSGDHIVPHPGHSHDTQDVCQGGEACKKPRRETNDERNMMEQESWSRIRDRDGGADADADADADLANAMPSSQSGDTNLSSHCFKSSKTTSGSELCTDEGNRKGTSRAAVDTNSFNHSQTHIRQSDDVDLNLFSNHGGDKETNDLLYYGWPDIGNFEDMDKMLSNCDSSFGLGVTSNDDELVWFTSEDPAGGYEEALKMDLKFPCSEPSALTNVSQDNEPQGSENMRSSFVSESKDEFVFKDQKEQSRKQNQSKVSIADQSSGSFGLKTNEIQLSSSEESAQVFTSVGNQQQNKILGHDSFGYTQNTTYLHPMQTTSDSMITDIKSENNVCFMESSGDPIFQGTASEISGKNKVRHAHAFQPSFSGNQSQSGMRIQTSEYDKVPSQKQFYMSENKVESQSDMEGVEKGVSAELGLLDGPESSSISSELDEISLEATSFRQLQQVMEQLDLRTKLCIRDSLYRLAKSAEQRHNYAGISESTANYGGTGGPIMTEGTNKYAGLMDMETDTNPIDRTIAHLLFHRPPDANNGPTSLPLRPNAKIPGSTIGQPMVTEKLSCQKRENESDDKISSTGKN